MSEKPERQNDKDQVEPSVWDWFVSLFSAERIRIPLEWDDADVEIESETEKVQELELVKEAEIQLIAEGVSTIDRGSLIRVPAAISLALLAQFILDLKPTNPIIPVLIYLFSFGLMAWAVLSGDFTLSGSKTEQGEGGDSEIRISHLLFGAGFAVFTFFLSRGNTFTLFNLLTWGASLYFFLLAFWQGVGPSQVIKDWFGERRRNGFNLHFGTFEVLFILAILIAAIYRLASLDFVPTDMWSDQAEKLLDVLDILEGDFSIYFPRNTGREGLQIYMAAATAALLGTGTSFMTLKIGTALAGLATLPYIYLFAKEFGGKYVGLLAMFLAGVAHWPNIISRLGLRFPLYPLFAAPALYYLIRGLRRKSRNDFLLSGFAMGLGLHGYSPARVIPLAVIIGALIYILHIKDQTFRRRVLTWTIMSGVIALAVFMPLLGAVVEMPDLYLFRMLSRVGTVERSYPGSPLLIFVQNLWDSLRMFAWDSGDLWVVTVPGRPVLDWVTGAFFHLGVVITLFRYIRKRDWKDLFLLLLIPILMLPSVLSLAFPGENPAPNRASAAIVPVYAIAAGAFVMLPKWLRAIWKDVRAKYVISAMFVVLIPIILLENYHLTFNQFATQHRRRTWNTREVGEYINGFATTVGDFDTAHVIATPHWLDGRLVAMIAGADPRIDYSIWLEDLHQLQDEVRPQLFILRPDDAAAISQLTELFPGGSLTRYKSDVEGHDFMIYFVPSAEVEEYPTSGMDG